MVQYMDALETLVGEAGGGVLAFPVVQTGGQIRRDAHAHGDGQGVLDQQGLSVRKGGVPGVDVLGDGLGLFHLGHIIHDRLGGLAGEDAVLHAGAQISVPGAVAPLGLVEGIGLGLRVGVVRAPVAHQEAELARPAHRGQEAVRRALGDEDFNKVRSVVQHPFQLLLEHLALLVPVGGGGVVGQLHLDGEVGPRGGQLLNGGVPVLLGGRLVKELREIGQPAALGVVHSVGGGAEGGRGDGAELIALVPLGSAHRQGHRVVDAVQKCLAEIGVVDRLGPVVRLILGVQALHRPAAELVAVGHAVEHVKVGVVGVGPVHRDDVLGGGVGQPAVQDVRADGGLVDLPPLDHLGAVDLGLGVVDPAHRLDKDLLRVVVLGVLLHDPALQRLVFRQVEGAAAVGGLGRGGELVPHLLQQRPVCRFVGQIDQQAQKSRKAVGQGIGQGVLVHRLHPHLVEFHRGEDLGLGPRGGDGHIACTVQGVGGAVLGCVAVLGVGAADLVVVVLPGPGDVSGHKARVGGGVGRGQDIPQRVHKVLGGHRGHHFAVAVHPVFIPQMEGPGQGVGVELPLGGQALPQNALGVVLQQGVHAVGAHLHLHIRGGGQIVEGGRLAGIEDGITALIPGSGVPGAGSAAAASAGKPGGAGPGSGQPGGFEKLAAGHGVLHHSIPRFDKVFLRVRPNAENQKTKRSSGNIRCSFAILLQSVAARVLL